MQHSELESEHSLALQSVDPEVKCLSSIPGPSSLYAVVNSINSLPSLCLHLTGK